MTNRLLLFCALLLIPLGTEAFSALAPQDVMVVYNSSPAFVDSQTGRNVSKAVADYYRTVRNIPVENEIGVYMSYHNRNHFTW